MKDSTARVVRASLLAQRRAKWRILEGYGSKKESLVQYIKTSEQRIQEAKDQIKRIKEDEKQLQEDMAGLVDAYHDLWDEEFPDDDELKR